MITLLRRPQRYFCGIFPRVQSDGIFNERKYSFDTKSSKNNVMLINNNKLEDHNLLLPEFQEFHKTGIATPKHQKTFEWKQ